MVCDALRNLYDTPKKNLERIDGPSLPDPDSEGKYQRFRASNLRPSFQLQGPGEISRSRVQNLLCNT